LQRRVRPLAVAHAVVKKYGDDRGGQLAMLLAYKGFFSVFPLLLAFVATLGLVLSGNDELRQDLIDSTLASVPVIGTEIADGAESLDGSIVVLVGSILVSVWAGLGLLDMLQESLNTVWDVRVVDRPPWIQRRLRDVPGALLIAACAVLSGAARWVLADDAATVVRTVAGVVLPVAAGMVAFAGLHLLLCARAVPWRAQLPGAAVVGIGWWALQTLGGWFITRYVARSSDTYGVFVVVLGLLSWSYLLGTLYLYGLELSSVLHERRWPRSLTGRDLTDADVAAYGVLAEREVRVPGTQIDIEVPRTPIADP
jgi:YihY family inner membrane protein